MNVTDSAIEQIMSKKETSKTCFNYSTSKHNK